MSSERRHATIPASFTASFTHVQKHLAMSFFATWMSTASVRALHAAAVIPIACKGRYLDGGNFREHCANYSVPNKSKGTRCQHHEGLCPHPLPQPTNAATSAKFRASLRFGPTAPSTAMESLRSTAPPSSSSTTATWAIVPAHASFKSRSRLWWTIGAEAGETFHSCRRTPSSPIRTPWLGWC